MPLLLSYLNVSNKSNLLADSGFIFQRLLLEGLTKLGWETILVGPRGVSEVFPGATIELPMPDQKYGIRLGFSWCELEREMGCKHINPDVLLVNQPELTPPLAALTNTVCGRKVPVVTYFHYLPIEGVSASGELLVEPSLNDYGLGGYLWGRQVEAAQYSDLALIGSEWDRHLFLEASRRAPQLSVKFHVLPPPVEQQHPEPPPAVADPARVFNFLYNHRLYAHYGTRVVFAWLNDLHRNSRVDFQVTVTNPTSRRSALRKKLDSSVEDILGDLERLPFVSLVEASTREEYLAAVSAADAGVAPLRRGALWSMAVADVMAAGRPVIGRRSGAFPEVIGDEDLLFSDRESFLQVAERLIVDEQFRMTKGATSRQRAAVWERENVCDHLAALLRDVLTSAP